MFNYVTKSFVSSVWPWKLAQAGDETFKAVLTEWHLREDADWLVVDVPQEVQHSFKLQVNEFQACCVDFGLGERTAFCSEASTASKRSQAQDFNALLSFKSLIEKSLNGI